MIEVVVSSAELKQVAGIAEEAAGLAADLDIGGETGDVAAAMPGATAVSSVAEVGTFMDSLSQSLGDSLTSFVDAVRLADDDYNATDHTASLDFDGVTEELGDY
ncbi:hypothetical protein [Flaviflexus massiliensis]|uniref:hypothetical protein n=1 Tax=Flaviflexus massiliensis TaxID=1522309 RepID=UPI0006D5AB39|nr:hypothetical protein [Flaviflexus massiliensis]